MDRKDSSHVGSPHYDAEITSEGGELATYPRKNTESPRLLAAFIARIGTGGLLSHREEVELCGKAQSGDSEARRRLVEKNLQLAVSEARKHRGQGLPLEVLIQERNMGLMTAEKF